ncbi:MULTISPECIES: GAF domain-containing protein [unclassified Streptomyces]|uniref:GAF domain-containing protein n=1 Tax=unclassified Streptomyces TaxID=2593676 RepID=UPI002E2CF220|nr:GAF domain-containing protein [Streptomyces sp. NBC_01423]WSX94216.1 GAF domain-containing protein [Streptomyces sp. NBC_00891]WSY08693.1 GAF domain-containing protein [Streptomyces sp. NBC_00890]WSZ10316.1 GAF domain-containing protein [Streptomyces sp. NBC_00869]WSZ22181.1 GAF domain-containing protein [Streptomyces sp. NBC_00870]
MTPERKNKVIEAALTTLAIIFGSVAFALSVVAGQTPSINWPLLIAGIISTAITLVVAAVEKVRANKLRAATEQLARDSEARYELLVSGLTPSAKHVAAIAGLTAASAPLETQRGRLDQSVAVSASGVAPGSRGMFYRYDQATAVFTLAAEWPGGARQQFGPNDPGHFPMKRAAEDGFVFEADDRPSPFKQPAAPGPPQEHAVVIVPVRVGTLAIGVLAVDSDRSSWPTGVTAYSNRDIRQLLLLADLLTAGLTP